MGNAHTHADTLNNHIFQHNNNTNSITKLILIMYDDDIHVVFFSFGQWLITIDHIYIIILVLWIFISSSSSSSMKPGLKQTNDQMNKNNQL